MTEQMTGIDMVAAMEAKHAVLRLAPEAASEEKLRAAMAATKGHWLLVQMGHNQGRELRAAVAGFVLAVGVDHPDAVRAVAEHASLSKLGAALGAAQQGVVVDWGSLVTEAADGGGWEPIGLLRIWREVTT